MKKIYILCGLLLFLCSGCKTDYAIELQNAVADFLKGKKGSAHKIAQLLLKKNSFAEIEEKNLILYDNNLFSKTDGMIFHYPVKAAIAAGKVKPLLFSVNKEHTVYSDKKSISLVNNKDGELKTFTAATGKQSIKSLAVYDGKIFFYRDQQLYSYDIATGNTGQYIKTVFSPPFVGYYRKFQNDYNVSLLQRENMLGVLLGNGGSYLFSLVDMRDKSIKIRDLATSSSKIAFNSKSISYISGNAGLWQFITIDLATKRKKTWCTFKDLLDLYIVQDGYVLITNKGTVLSGYDCKPVEVPSCYRLHGTVNDSIVLSYNQHVFICAFSPLLADLKITREKIPDFFKNK